MDWATSFESLSSKASSGYGRLLKKWQELLGKIGRGELTAHALNERIPQLLQEEGAELYRGLTSLSFELFRSISELQGSYTDEFVRGLLGDGVLAGQGSVSSPPLPPSESADPEEWTRWYQAVNGYLAEQSQSALARYQVLLEKVATGRLTPANIQEYSRKFMNERALLLSRDAAELQMRFYEGLIQLNQNFAENLFGRLTPNGSAPPDGAVESISLDMVGPAGATVSASLVVENSATRPSDVTCRVSEFKRADGAGQSFRPPLELEPGNFRLAAGETRNLVLRLQLIPEMFEPETNYNASLVINQAEQSIVVFLRARAVAVKQKTDEAAPLILNGSLGKTASGALALTNTGGARAQVHCTVSEVRRADGSAPAFPPKMAINRESFKLEPGQAATLSVIVNLEKKNYEAGPLYIGTLHVRGLGNSGLEVPLHITASKASAPKRPTKKSPTRKRKRKAS